jgi:hypothetical protein
MATGDTLMALSSLALSKAKPREKPYKLAEGHGLYLLITPQGGRYWRMNYRFEGKAKTMAMGVFPLITLAEAREKREAARKLLAAGSDPTATRKEAEAREPFEATTGFRTVAEEWLAKREREGLGDVTLGKAKWLLEFAYARGEYWEERVAMMQAWSDYRDDLARNPRT